MQKGTNKGKGIMTMGLALMMGLCVAVPTVRAQGLQINEPEQAVNLQTLGTGLVSRGNLVYQEGESGAQIYAADFLLLKNKLDTIPSEIFEPAGYTLARQWEDLDVNEETYSRCYESCGEAFSPVCEHKAEREENCTFSHDGTEYSGRRYTCACGYQWEQEAEHTLLFETVDETHHRSRCQLEGTVYCSGYEPVVEEHYAYHYKPCEDGRHHKKICMDCGCWNEEECCFSLTELDVDGENGRRCWCGNVEVSTAETGEGDANTVSGEENADAEPEEKKQTTESDEESSGTGVEEEKPATEPDGEQPGIDEGKEKSDAEVVEEKSAVELEEERSE